jgi:hypothetical protein
MKLRSFFRFLYVLNEVKPQIMDAYAAFLIWTLARWIRAVRSTVFTARDWFGCIGILAGSLSWRLLEWFNICCIVQNKNLAEGSGYDAYFIVSSCAAVVGMILTLMGRSPVRGSAFIVSLVMVLQWRYMWGGGSGLDEITTFATLVLLAMYGVISLGRWYFRPQVAQT